MKMTRYSRPLRQTVPVSKDWAHRITGTEVHDFLVLKKVLIHEVSGLHLQGL